MTADTEPRPPDGTLIAWAWIVNLGPPLLALADLQLGYMLVSRNCLEASALTNHLTHAGFLALVLLLIMRARSLRAAGGGGGDSTDPDPRTRTRFLGMLGMLIGGISALVIVTHWLPVFLLHPCQ